MSEQSEHDNNGPAASGSAENPAGAVHEDAWGGRPIPETILDFGQPILSALGPDTPNQTAKDLVKIVVTVWNCHVMAMPLWGQRQHLENLVAVMESGLGPATVKDAYDLLTARRLAHFAQDPRAVGHWEVAIDGGALRFQCDARLPPGSRLQR